MKHKLQDIQTLYLLLTLLNTLAASFIWGVNTLFLLSAGLNNTQAFLANAFFTLGQVIFEVPTGIIADSLGRRTSYMLGTVTLGISTLLYLFAWQVRADFWIWAGSSVLLGLGFTFFSGATEAWLVDALKFTGYTGKVESVFAKGQIVGGVAMLVGSVAGGAVAQVTHLGVPYILRSAVLGINFFVALIFMKDLGFTPKRSNNLLTDMKKIFTTSVHFGLRTPAVRWIMIAGPFSIGVSYYVFYALQPHLLMLYGDEKAYGIAGLAAAIVAGAQILGGFAVPYVRRFFRLRTSVFIFGIAVSAVFLTIIGLTGSFILTIISLIVWGLLFAAVSPVRQAYLNALIPSTERATVLSFDSLIGSSGGVVIQPTLGKVADVWGYPSSFMVGGVFQLLAIPFILLARKSKTTADFIE